MKEEARCNRERNSTLDQIDACPRFPPFPLPPSSKLEFFILPFLLFPQGLILDGYKRFPREDNLGVLKVTIIWEVRGISIFFRSN